MNQVHTFRRGSLLVQYDDSDVRVAAANDELHELGLAEEYNLELDTKELARCKLYLVHPDGFKLVARDFDVSLLNDKLVQIVERFDEGELV